MNISFLLSLELVTQQLVSEVWDSRVSLLQTGHRGIFAITFFYEASEVEIFRVRSRNLEEGFLKISDLGS